MNTLYRYVRPKLPVMGLQLAVKFFGTIVELLLPWMLSHILDDAVPARDVGGVWMWGAWMVACAAAALAANIYANRLSTRISRDITRRLRRDLFARVLTLGSAQEDTFTTPSLISRLTSDTYNTHRMVDRMQRLGVRAPILLVGGILLCLLLDPVLTLVLAAVLPALGLVVWKISGSGVRLYTAAQSALDTLVRRAQESMAGIRVIQALSRAGYERERFGEANGAVAAGEQRASLMTSLSGPVMNLLLNTGLTAVIVVGALRVDRGLSTPGTIIAFLSYFTIILNALMMVSRMFVMYSKGAASARRIEEVLTAPLPAQLPIPAPRELYRPLPDEVAFAAAAAGRPAAEVALGYPAPSDTGSAPAAALDGPQAPAAKAAPVCPASPATGATPAAAALDGPQAPAAAAAMPQAPCIEFCDVSFSYNGVCDTVQHISFSLYEGQTLGILGPTGEGKSTLLRLLLGFYMPQQGCVRLWGVPVKDYPPDVLYSLFGVVFQNDFLYAGTLAEAIDMGRGLSAAQLQAGAAHAQADFALQGKEGLAAPLAVRGSNLSGGQKQRLLLARALAADPPILLLDDSSSALDYRTDAALRRALARHHAEATKVIVAQRVSALRAADLILVLEDGRITGRGTHEQLMKSCAIYRETAALQMGEGAMEGGKAHAAQS